MNIRKISNSAKLLTLAWLCFGTLWAEESGRAEVAEIVVSIKPLHSLVCALTKGIAEPKLLLDGNFSPHHFQLRPSQVQAMKKTKCLIWIGPAYEQPLQLHVNKLTTSILTIQDCAQIKFKQLRNGRFWDEKTCCNHSHDAHHHHHQAGETNLDGHIWLDPKIMEQVVDAVLEHLIPLYPQHRKLLEQNAELYKKRLEVLHQDLLQQLAPYQGQTYIIQHDGNQYFDQAYGVQTIATLSIDPKISPSAGHLLKIRQAISEGEIAPKCLFAERQMDGALAKSFASALKLSFAILDYLGAEIPAGEDAYEALMQSYVSGFIAGISQKT